MLVEPPKDEVIRLRQKHSEEREGEWSCVEEPVGKREPPIRGFVCVDRRERFFGWRSALFICAHGAHEAAQLLSSALLFGLFLNQRYGLESLLSM